MKVLFLYPNLRGMYMVPPAIAILSAILKQNGVEVELFDTTHWLVPGESDFDSDKTKEKNLNVRPYDFKQERVSLHTTDVFEDFEKKVQSFSPDLIAVSATEDIFLLGIRLLSHIRDCKIPTILGGVFSTFSPRLALSYKEIDMICVGEGEPCLPELCRRIQAGKPLGGVPNLWFRQPDGTIVESDLALPVPMEDNPLPDFSIFEETRLYRPMAGKIYRMLPVETHRGCPYSCSFCNSPSREQLYTDFRTTLKKNQDRTNSRDISENRPYLQAFSLLK